MSKKYSFEEFKNKFKNFSMLGGLGKQGVQDYQKLSDSFSTEDIHDWLLDPNTNKEQIANVSRYLYVTNGINYFTINYYVNLMTLDKLVIPRFSPFIDINPEDIWEKKEEVNRYVEQAFNKPQIRNILKGVFKDSAFFGYERSEGDNYIIQRLPNAYSREGAIVDGLPSVEFNFSYFDNAEEKLELYDAEFTTKYNAYNSSSEPEWQQLEPDVSFTIPLESEDYNFPLLTGSFIDNTKLDDFFEYLKKGVEKDVSKLIVQKAPLDADGEPQTDPELLMFFQKMLEDTLDEDTSIVSTIFDLDTVDFTKSKANDGGLTSVDTMMDKTLADTGISRAVLGDTDSATGFKVNHNANISTVMAILEKIELVIERRISILFEDDIKYKVNFLPTTRLNQGEIYKTYNGLLSIGGSLMATISSAGTDPELYMDLVRYENLMGYKEELEVTGNINTQSAEDSDGEDTKVDEPINDEDIDDGEPGRPEEDDLSDGGEDTKDNDGNDR